MNGGALKRKIWFFLNDAEEESPPMEVAVTLSLGGNHAADTSGGAEQKMMPGNNDNCEEAQRVDKERIYARDICLRVAYIWVGYMPEIGRGGPGRCYAQSLAFLHWFDFLVAQIRR